MTSESAEHGHTLAVLAPGQDVHTHSDHACFEANSVCRHNAIHQSRMHWARHRLGAGSHQAGGYFASLASSDLGDSGMLEWSKLIGPESVENASVIGRPVKEKANQLDRALVKLI